MELVGRITADAKVKTLKDNRQLVVFSVAENHRYKTKDGEKKEDTTFFNCSYWLSTKIADSLKKGSLVSLFGHVGLNAYKDMAGDFQAHLVFHVNNIQIIAFAKKGVVEPVAEGTPNEADLPF